MTSRDRPLRGRQGRALPSIQGDDRMNRIIYAVAVWTLGVSLAWAQQPDGGAAAPPPAAAPEVAPATGDPAPADTGRRTRPGNGAGVERTRRRNAAQDGSIPGAFMDGLRQERPELYKRLSKLYQEDRERFFEEVRGLMRERGTQTAAGNSTADRSPRSSAEERRCNELARQYRESNDPAEKERIKADLAAAVQAAFEARLRSSHERIARLEQQLKDFRERLEHMEANRDQICAGRLNELTTPPELRWDGNW
jgi:hypothetical protein